LTKNYRLSLSRKTRTSYGGLLILWQLFFSAFCIYLSLQNSLLFWLAGQILLGISLLQWFFIEHDLGHGTFLPSHKLSQAFGLIASVFTLIPYTPWVDVHHAHHKWTGWREKDPTIPARKLEDLSPFTRHLIDFLWKYWIPVIALTYVITTFWNLKKLKIYFPERKKIRSHQLQIAFLMIIYVGLILLFGLTFIKVWLGAFIVYLFISDPYLLSQHTHLEYKNAQEEPIKPVRYIDQDTYSRTVRFPNWVEKYIFYNSNNHGLHHQFPWIPIYVLHQHKTKNENTIDWVQWLSISKKIPGHILIYSDRTHSGYNI